MHTIIKSRYFQAYAPHGPGLNHLQVACWPRLNHLYLAKRARCRRFSLLLLGRAQGLILAAISLTTPLTLHPAPPPRRCRPQWRQHHPIMSHRSLRRSLPPHLPLAPRLWSPHRRAPPLLSQHPLERHRSLLPGRSRSKWLRRHTWQPAYFCLLSSLPNHTEDRRM